MVVTTLRRPLTKGRKAARPRTQLRSHSSESAQRRFQGSFEGVAGPLDIVSLVPLSIPPEQASRLLASVLHDLINDDVAAAVKAAMKHPYFSFHTLYELVKCARQCVEAPLRRKNRELSIEVQKIVRKHEESAARLALEEAVNRERAEATRLKNKSKIAPAQAKRTRDAKNRKIVEELRRMRSAGENIHARHICAQVAMRFGVTASHVRNVRSNTDWRALDSKR